MRFVGRRSRLPVPGRRDEAELLDDPARVAADLPANLADIRRLNRWFGGTSAVLRYLESLVPADGVTSLLDVATGSADIPLAVYRWSEARGRVVRIDALDLHEDVLKEARRVIGPLPIGLHHGDALALPFAARSFDVVTCCLALHHFAPNEAVHVLSEMWRVTRHAILVVDLRRDYAGFAGAWLATRTVARNRLTRHDGPLSVLRAYTSDELRDLAHRAGITNASVRDHAFFRLALRAERAADNGR